MKPPGAFTGFSIQFMAVINADRADGRKIVKPHADGRTKLIRTFVDNRISDTADIVKKRQFEIRSQTNPGFEIAQNRS